MTPQLPNELILEILELTATDIYYNLGITYLTKSKQLVNIAMVSVTFFKRVLKIVTIEQVNMTEDGRRILADALRQRLSIHYDLRDHVYRQLSLEHARVYDVKEAMARAVNEGIGGRHGIWMLERRI